MTNKFKATGASWDSMFLTAVKLITTFTSILQTKVLSVGLSLTDYGTYAQANIIVSFCTSILMLGLPDALSYFYNRKSGDSDIEKHRYVSTIFLIESACGTAFTVLLLIFKEEISSFFSNSLLAGLMLFIAAKPMMDNIIFLYQVLFMSCGKAKLIALRNFLLSLIRLAIIYISVQFIKDIRAIFVSLLVLDFIQLAFFAGIFKRDCFSVSLKNAKKGCIRPVVTYAVPLGIFALTKALTRDIDKMIVSRLADTETVAIYANCSKLLPMDMIAASFLVVLLPYIVSYVSSNDKANSVMLIRNYLRVGYFSVWILGAAVLVVPRQAISFLYSDQYLTGYVIFIIYVLESMIAFAGTHLILTAAGQTKVLMRYSAITLAANILLDIVLFHAVGILGPAIATLFVVIMYVFLILRKTKHILNASVFEFFDFKEIFVFIIQLTALGIIFGVLNQRMLSVGVNRFVSMMVIMGGFAFMNLCLSWKKIADCLRIINSFRV